MSDFSNKYGNNARGLWRKVYGYNNRKPELTTIVDTVSNTTYSLDLNKTVRHRDYYIIDGFVGAIQETPVEILPFEYEEGLIYLNYDEFGNTMPEGGIGFFTFPFTATPIVVLQIESASLYGENLNIFGTELTSQQFSFGLSAPFTGSIRYRAINMPSYPAYVTSAYTSSITASAGIANITGLTAYTASFAALPGTPFRFMQTVWDTSYSNNVDVHLETQTTSSNSATVEFSSDLTAAIHFIAFSS